MKSFGRHLARSGRVQTPSRHVDSPSLCAIQRQLEVNAFRQRQKYPSILPILLPTRRSFSSFDAPGPQKPHATTDQSTEKDAETSGTQSQRRKMARSPAANSSLRRVAVEAQRTRSGILTRTQLLEKGLGGELKVGAGAACKIV